MRESLERFLTRRRVIELTTAVAVGLAALNVIQAAVSGLVTSPIRQTSGGEFGDSTSTGEFTIGHRVFDWISPLSALLVLAAVLAVVGLVARRLEDDEPDAG